ncbi:MAG TPA: hypothetical protein PLD86_10625 [Vicinamibacteria bacterium]|nr:hypothetical protein [Vicinamibacteria bacterium]
MIRRRDLLARFSLFGALGGPRIARASPGSPLILSIDGPLIVTGDLARQRDLFEGVLGLGLVADQELGATAVKDLFGVAARAARTVLLHTRGTAVGVRLVEFRHSSSLGVREGARPTDADALKVVDFVVPDLGKATAALAARGFRLAAPPASYSTPEDGRLTEGHVEGPDGVVCGLLQMHNTPPAKYVKVTDQTFSEVLGVSAPVSDRDSALAFYRETLKLPTVLSYEIANESFQKLLRSREKIFLRGANFGIGARAPMIGVIHYGLPPHSFRSLRQRAVLPHRGLQALRFSVPSVDAVAGVAAAANLEVVAGPAETLLFPQGRIRSILIRAPHGVLHHFTETVKA